jgi:hypothetical protein
MTRVNSIKDIGLVYEQVLKRNTPALEQVEVVEEKAVRKLDTFPCATDKKIDVKKITSKGSDKNAFVHKDSGPEAKLGVKKEIIDPKTAKEDNHYQPQKFSDNTKKLNQENINNSMKSIFDKLYEDVMGDDKLDVGIQAGPEGEAADAKDLDLSSGIEDTITVKLDKDVAQKLHDALMSVLGSDEAADDEIADDEIADDEAAAEMEEIPTEVAGEGVDIKEVPASAGQSLQKKGGVPTVGTKTGHAKGSKASGTVGNEVDGSGTPVADAKGLSLTAKTANKVNAPGYKAGDFFK